MMQAPKGDRRRPHACGRSSFGLPVAAVVAGLLALVGRAKDGRATDADADRAARAHFHQAEAKYAAGSYAEALSEYQAGYDVQPLPGFLVNIAQCQRRMGDLERARATYGKFVLVAPDSPLLPEVRGLIEELDRLIAETARARALPSVAAPDSASSPAVAAVPSAAPSAMEPRAQVGTRVAPGVDLTEAPMAPSERLPNDRPATISHRRWWLWGSVAVVALGAAAAAALLSGPEVNTIHDGSIGTLRR